MSRSARERLTDIQTAIAKVYAYRASLKGEHSDMAVSAILREIGIIGEAVNALPEDLPRQVQRKIPTPPAASRTVGAAADSRANERNCGTSLLSRYDRA